MNPAPLTIDTPGFGELFNLARTFVPHLGSLRQVSAPPAVQARGGIEARIRKAETRYKNLVERIPVVTFMVSFENRSSEIYVSPQVESLLGYSAKEWVEDPILWYSRLHRDDRGQWNREFSRTIAAAEPFKGDYRFLAKDGHVVWIHGEVTVERDDDGQPSFLQGIGYDITELKRAEEVLQRSGEELESLVKTRTAEITEINKALQHEIELRRAVQEQMQDNLKELADVKSALDEHAIVAITNPQGRITHVNDKFCAISKYSREELIGQDHRIINSGYHPKEFIRDLWQTIANGRVWKGEICNRAKDGRLYWVDTTIVPFLGADGRPAQYVAIRADITERKRAEQRQAELMNEMQDINEQLNQFAYVVSHDLKAPLRGISSLADWLTADYSHKIGPAGQEQFGLLQGRVKRMSALIDGILRYSRISRQQGETMQVDVNLLLLEVQELVVPPAGIQLRMAPGFPTLLTERVRLLQVFENLVSNAIKYMGQPTGQIDAGWEDAGGHWTFYVRDTGVGIDEKYFEKIFQLFQTLASRDERESTGIGLAVVKKNVEFLGGRVWVESQLGAGSTFFFTHPKAPAVARQSNSTHKSET